MTGPAHTEFLTVRRVAFLRSTAIAAGHAEQVDREHSHLVSARLEKPESLSFRDNAGCPSLPTVKVSLVLSVSSPIPGQGGEGASPGSSLTGVV